MFMQRRTAVSSGFGARNIVERDSIRDDSAVVQDAVEPVLLRGLLETTEDCEMVAALLALVVLVEVPASDVEPVALDRDRPAARTVRVLQGMAGHVPDVDVLEALLLRNGAMLLEGLDGRPGELHHLVVRVEPQEVDRRVGAEVVVDPLRKFSGGREVVADLGDDEVRDLDVDLLRVPRVEERLEDRIRVRDVDVLPDEIRLAGSLEVHRDAVQELRHLRDGLRRVVAVRHEDVDEAGLPSQHPDVSGELDEDGRLIVRVRQALAALLQSHPDDVLRFDLDAFDLASLGDVGILAVPAVMNDEPVGDVVVVRDTFKTVDGLETVRPNHRVNRQPHLLVGSEDWRNRFFDKIQDSAFVDEQVPSPDSKDAPAILFQCSVSDFVRLPDLGRLCMPEAIYLNVQALVRKRRVCNVELP